MSRSIRATRHEQTCNLPGDELVREPIVSATHGVTIRRPRCDVWPWLIQMGAGRAGWYAYDFIDNGGQRSAKRILPELQNIAVGSLFPALPGATDAFVVVEYEAERTLVLGVPSPDGGHRASWTFILEEPEPDCTRLLVRGRLGGRRPYGLPRWIVKLIGPLGHFIMQRKQLLGIARRVEAVESFGLNTIGGARGV